MTSPSDPLPGPPASPPASWYPDPSDPEQIRYWDGTAWTGHTAARTIELPLEPAADAPEASAPTTGPGGRPYASFWRRALGLLIDAVLLGIPLMIVLSIRLEPQLAKFTSALEALGPEPSQADINRIAEELTASLPVGTIIGVGLLIAGLNLLYFGVGLHLWGRTVGGQLTGIRCVDAEGAYPTWRQSFIRAAVPAGFNLMGSIPGIGFFGSALWMVNYLSMVWHPQRQGWMDRAAGTFVVRR